MSGKVTTTISNDLPQSQQAILPIYSPTIQMNLVRTAQILIRKILRRTNFLETSLMLRILPYFKKLISNEIQHKNLDKFQCSRVNFHKKQIVTEIYKLKRFAMKG